MSNKGKLLIVDDEFSVRDSLAKWFREEGYEVTMAESANEALTRVAEQTFDVALVDIKMRGTDGIELQRRLHELSRHDGHHDDRLCLGGDRSRGAAERRLRLHQQAARSRRDCAPGCQGDGARRVEQENVRLKEQIEEHAHVDMVWRSDAMKKVFEAIETVAPTDATVLITGESGTGKEVVARAVHACSTRRFHPMVVMHCGALTETLLESELFGHEKGAFTGRAVSQER